MADYFSKLSKVYDEYIEANKLPSDYKSAYFVYIQPLPDGNVSVMFSKGSPSSLWTHMFRKYY